MKVRKATKEDCPAMLKLIQELADYEKAPEEVTVDPKHFEESGFGSNPVWWAFVAEGERTDVSSQMSEDRRQITDNSSQMSDDRRQISDDRSQMSDDRSQISDNRYQISDDIHQTTDDCHLISNISISAFALYYIRYSTWKGQVMYLEDLLVTESMRGKGIGAMLLDRLIIEAKERGFKRIVWQVLDWNEPAINFYKKHNASFDAGWMNVTLDL
jgi:GNAT superfamily N-acetyltransferase